MIIADVLVLAVTWMKTAQLYLEARRIKVNAPLATMLFRDGKGYIQHIEGRFIDISNPRDHILHVRP